MSLKYNYQGLKIVVGITGRFLTSNMFDDVGNALTHQD